MTRVNLVAAIEVVENPPSFSSMVLVENLLAVARTVAKEALPPSVARELKEALDAIDAAVIERQQFAAEVAQAREQYADDDLEFDDNPLLSVADDGVWVNCWAWAGVNRS